MKKTNPTILLFTLALIGSVVLAGCGSGGDADVDQGALNARNAQRQGASGAPPSSGTAGGSTASK